MIAAIATIAFLAAAWAAIVAIAGSLEDNLARVNSALSGETPAFAHVTGSGSAVPVPRFFVSHGRIFGNARAAATTPASSRKLRLRWLLFLRTRLLAASRSSSIARKFFRSFLSAASLV